MKNKKNIILYTTMSIILVVGIVLFVVGGYFAGWDFIAWFKSPYAIWVYFLVGVYLIALFIYWLWEKYSKM